MTEFKRYRTPSGSHVTLSEAWAGPGFEELKEDPLGIDGKPKPPIQPIRKTTIRKTTTRKSTTRKTTGNRPVTATEAAEPEATKEATK